MLEAHGVGGSIPPRSTNKEFFMEHDKSLVLFTEIGGQELLDLVDYIEDKSSECIKRLRVHFKNGYQLSIIFGYGTFGYLEGTFEIAAFDNVNSMDSRLIGLDHPCDELGYQTKENIFQYMKMLGSKPRISVIDQVKNLLRSFMMGKRGC